MEGNSGIFQVNTMSSSADNRRSPKKVAIIGPECTGKSTLAATLARAFETEWVPEYARNYIERLNRPYEKNDLTKIAHGQIRLEDEWIQSARRVLFCDTNLVVIKVWSEHKYGDCDPEILEALKSRHYDLLLLTNIDIPWVADPQREHPDKRDYFWKIYLHEAAQSGIPFVEVSGDPAQRLATATQAVNNILAS